MPATAEGIAEAAARLRDGGLVAFPTETVYGLGANALDAEAAACIFHAKGRPATNPLIVHVPDTAAAQRLSATPFNDTALALANKFWPGPLTLVVAKAAAVPDIVTAGGPTVALRVPDHPVALELLRKAGVPIAAPSANRSEEVSPTTAEHVADSLGPWLDDLLILDGGPCRIGVESTVVDVTGYTPRILRPGMVTQAMLRGLAGSLSNTFGSARGAARSPGQMVRHYAPRAPVVVVPEERLAAVLAAGDGVLDYGNLTSARGKPVTPALAEIPALRNKPSHYAFNLPPDAGSYAAYLYAALRALDVAGAVRILVVEPPYGPEWEAIHDRLRRAAAPKSHSEAVPLPARGEHFGEGIGM